MTVREERNAFVLSLANEVLFAPTRTKTMRALQTIAQRMHPDHISRFPKNAVLFAPEVNGDAGLIIRPTREHILMYLDPALEQKPQEEVTRILAVEMARLITHDPEQPATEAEREAIADLVGAWTSEEQAASAA